MRIGFYGMENISEQERNELFERIQEKYKKYVLEFVEGIQNENATNTDLNNYGIEHDVKVVQIPARWSDLTGCKFPKTNKAGLPYNPGAANRRDQEVIQYLKEHKKNMMVIVTNEKDRFAGYNAWLAGQYEVPVYMLDADTGKWSTNDKNIEVEKQAS